MAVVDASVIFELLAAGEREEAAAARLLGERRAFWAPELLDAEVGSALRRAVRHRNIDADRAAEALGELRKLPIHRVSHERLAQFAWLLRDNVSFYDGLYVALAQLLEKPLLTFDARLARAGVDVEVEILAS
ncbi:MAG TPA: type II toxin-antitoxin system VapC family toxin [Solirubrobacterales bacterium]|nr:type II toxin-antitoxin system VapC family toxin [Solirubrobacterales bacterium]